MKAPSTEIASMHVSWSLHTVYIRRKIVQNYHFNITGGNSLSEKMYKSCHWGCTFTKCNFLYILGANKYILGANKYILGANMYI